MNEAKVSCSHSPGLAFQLPTSSSFLRWLQNRRIQELENLPSALRLVLLTPNSAVMTLEES